LLVVLHPVTGEHGVHYVVARLPLLHLGTHIKRRSGGLFIRKTKGKQTKLNIEAYREIQIGFDVGEVVA